MSYTPEYAPGKIIVWIDPPSENIAKALGEKLGYEVDDYIERYNGYIFNVPEGEEEKACERFEAVKEFVESASRFDIKIDKRYEQIEKLEELVGDLNDYAEDDENYPKKLKEIKKLIEKELNL